MSDLSEYEQRRLLNIQRNAEFLRNLGITTPDVDVINVKKASQKRKQRRELPPQTEVSTRKSRRLQEMAVKIEIAEDEGKEEGYSGDDDILSYDIMPFESSQLDDYEFQVYAALREWRLKKVKEKSEEIGEYFEPYKVCQNRTLCEIIRRKRNDIAWADPGLPDEMQYSTLREAWGIGDAKAKSGGIGREIVSVLEEAQNRDLLEKSRMLATPSTIQFRR
jgi:hypothetical protein